jgi:hypothetical protein
MIGNISGKKPSIYKPTQDVIDITIKVKQDYTEAQKLIEQTWVELNNRSVIQDQNRGQLMFNAFVDDQAPTPEEAWKWRGTRSMARNKGIAMHAQLTAGYLLPMFQAQDQNDDVDQEYSEMMRDIIEWMAEPTNSNYQSSFLQVVFGMITNPVTYIEADFLEVYQTIKARMLDGTLERQDVLDPVLSGFTANIWSATEILILNAHERNIQKQKAIIKRKYKEYDELKAQYGEHPHWIYVSKGIKSIYSEENGLFYDVKDDEMPNLLCEEIYLNRREDVEIPFINGIYMGDMNVDNNPIKHRDNLNRPKYNVVPFGYYRIGDHFFYYKSMMNCLGWDNMMYDAMSEVVMNRAFLETEMPIVVTGTDAIDSEVIFPNSVLTLENPDAKFHPMLPQSNLGAGITALRETEKSLNEGSAINETLAGQLPDKDQKAFNVAQAQSNAKTLVKGVGRSLAESIVQLGDLMKDIAINHLVIPQVEQISSGPNTKLKYKTFLIPTKDSTSSLDKKIRFEARLMGRKMSEEERELESVALLEECGYPDPKFTLIVANPTLFASHNYLTKANVEEMFTKNAEYWQSILPGLKQTLANDPYVNQQALTKRLLHAYFQSSADDLMNDVDQEELIRQKITAEQNAGGGGKSTDKSVQGMSNATEAMV